MRLTLEFYEIAANTIPLLLVALAVERFRIDADKTDRSQFRTGLTALAALIVAECLTLAILASRQPSRWSDSILMTVLSIGICFLAAAYANVLFSTFPTYRRRANRGRRVDLAVLGLALFSPIALIVWWHWPR